MSHALPPPLPATAPRAQALLAIVVLHALLIAVWLSTRWVVERPVERLGQLVWLALPPAPAPQPPAPTPRERTAAARPDAKPRSVAPPQPAPAPTTLTLPTAAPAQAAVTAVAEAPAAEPAASQPRTRLLDSDATRRAIRAAGSQPLLAERAEAATGIAIVSKGERFSEEAAKAGKGDCLKGDFAGSGAGVLSLPALAYAYAAGNCPK